MGWSNGSEHMELFLDIIEEYVPKNEQKEVIKKIFDFLTNQDWDTQGECLGRNEYYDQIYEEEFPENDDD